MPGPIFISHSSNDRDDVNALTEALRHTFNDDLRTFNTSSGTAIAVGATWRERILAALRAAPVVILWATEPALKSREVAFEIGAALAYERDILPCCIHIPPSELPWSLSERQALVMDGERGWAQLADAIADRLNYAGALDPRPLADLGQLYQAPMDAVLVESLGFTLEFRNRSSGPITDLLVSPCDTTNEGPSWAAALQGSGLGPGESVVILRDSEEESTVELSWTDVTGARRKRRVPIPATAGAE